MQNLINSELRYRRLFEAAQDGILILDAKTGMIEDVNPYLIKMLGYSHEEFVEKKLWEVGACKDIEASQNAFEALQENEYIRYKDLPLKTKDRRLIQVEFVSNVYLVGDEKVIQCNIRDITEHKGVEDALQKSEAKYRRLFEAAEDGILILDAKTGMIEDVNQYLIKMLGYSREEFVEKKLWEVGAFKDIKASQNAFEELQEKEYIRYENLPLRAKDGRLIQVEFVSNVYLVGDKKVIQCNIRDITARRDAEKDAHTAHTELLALVAEMQRRDSEMKLLIHMDDLLQSCTSVAEAYQVIAIVAGDLFSGQNGGLAILDTQNQHLEVVARWGDQAIIESAFLIKDCWAMRRGQPHEVIDPKKDLLCQHFVQPPETGTLCLPLMVQGETLGLLSLVGDWGGEHSISQRQLAVTVGEAIKLSLSNIKLREELREQAVRDPLTGLYNRRYLEESLERELYRSQRQKAQLCIALIDLDDFKQVNDAFGHGAGDSVLHEVGRILREHLRNSDIACRYGGDEFLLVLSDSALEDTRQRLDQIRILIKEQTIHYGEKLLNPITVSIGIAAAKEHNFSARELIHAADEALYAAKQAGNDQIFYFPTNKQLT